MPEHPNLQRALDSYLSEDGRQHEVLGVSIDPYGRASLADLIGQRTDQGPQPGPVEYLNVALQSEVLPCMQNGLYLITGSDGPLAAFVRGPNEASFRSKVHVEVMAARREAAESCLADLRRRMRERNVYRGRVVSLYVDEMHSLRVTFHHLGAVDRSAIILPEGLLERVEKQTMTFSAHAERLRALGRHMKRGLLLYGPPGTGKTLVTRYVINAMPGRTVLLLTGRGMGLIPQSCALARALQPATVVLEDVDRRRPNSRPARLGRRSRRGHPDYSGGWRCPGPRRCGCGCLPRRPSTGPGGRAAARRSPDGDARDPAAARGERTVGWHTPLPLPRGRSPHPEAARAPGPQ